MYRSRDANAWVILLDKIRIDSYGRPADMVDNYDWRMPCDYNIAVFELVLWHEACPFPGLWSCRGKINHLDIMTGSKQVKGSYVW